MLRSSNVITVVIGAFFLVVGVQGKDNGLAITPQMGCKSLYERYGCHFSSGHV
jgi:hypothetical protein